MQGGEKLSLEQIRALLEASQEVRFGGHRREEIYDAEAGTEALLRMPVGGQDPVHHLGGGRTDLAAPFHHPRWRPLHMPLVGLGPVLVRGGVAMLGRRAPAAHERM